MNCLREARDAIVALTSSGQFFSFDKASENKTPLMVRITFLCYNITNH
ncbi:hypothetical protein SDC9_88650 [bioreactor metagenome]|uniref:Uncharacterized protein n=1 Tax=bioreactor metagenome TaxID=1076179 RepID=A0A644ZNP4_9ZZZZ